MYIDGHNHLEMYGPNIDQALEIINTEGILTLACSMEEDSYLYGKKLRENSQLIIPGYGIHPCKIGPKLKDLDKLDKLAAYIDEASFLGEIGLDYFWAQDKASYPLQRKVLDFFLDQASKKNKLVNLHTKGAEEDILSFLKKYQVPRPIIHWYSGPLHLVKDFLDLGAYFTISVDILYSDLSQKLVEILPLNRILTETDGPTGLEWVAGQYAYPDYVKLIVREIGKIKKLEPGLAKAQIYSNFLKIREVLDE